MKRSVSSILAMIIFLGSLSSEAQTNSCAQIHAPVVSHIVDPKMISDPVLVQVQDAAKAEIRKVSPDKQKQIKKQAQEVVDQIYRLQKWADRTRKFNSNYENVAVYNARRRLYFLKQDMQLGYQTHAVGLYRDLFHKIENTYLTLQANLETLSKVRKNSPKYKSLVQENKKLFKTFGESFEEYLSVRTYLEGMALLDPASGVVPDIAVPNKTVDFRPVAQGILNELGVPAEHRISSHLQKPKERVDLKSLVEFYESHPENKIAKLKQDIRDDVVIFGKSLILNNPVFTFLRAATARLPQSGRVFVTKVLDLLLERHLVHRYMNHIDDVINADENVQVQLDMLRSKNDSSDSRDEMLVTFARLTMYSPKWAELRAYAHQVAQNTGSKIYSDFAGRMDQAEELAVRLGTFFPGHTDVKAVLARSGVATASGYLLIHYQVEILNWMERALGLGTEALGFAYEATKAMVNFN